LFDCEAAFYASGRDCFHGGTSAAGAGRAREPHRPARLDRGPN